MATEHQVDDTTIEQEQADFVRRTAGATETKIGHEAPATLPPSATDGTSSTPGPLTQLFRQWRAERERSEEEVDAYITGASHAMDAVIALLPRRL